MHILRRVLLIISLVMVSLNTAADSLSGIITTEQSSVKDAKAFLEIVTFPDYAEVYIDNVFIGRSPVTVNDLLPGLHLLRVEKSGYYPSSYWFTYSEDTNQTISVTLKMITGFLSLNISPPNAAAAAGSTPVGHGISELPIGRYPLTVKAFGYEPFETTIQIGDRTTTELSIILEPAEFRIYGFNIRRKRFNPENPGVLGTCVFSFEVSSWGTGEIIITDSSGIEIWNTVLEPFTTWSQRAEWDGRDRSGVLCPDGVYQAILTARGQNREIIEADTIIIDRSLTISYRSLLSGYSGLVLVPGADTLSTDSFQMSLNTMGTFMPGKAGAKIQAGFRIPLSGSLELTPGVSFSPGEEEISFGLKTGIKGRLFSAGPYSLAVQALWGFEVVSAEDVVFSPDPVFLSLPNKISAGVFSFLLSPEIAFSPQEGFYIRGGIGMLIESGPVWSGVSAGFRSTPFNQTFNLHSPIEGAAEFHWLLPRTQLVLSLILSGSFLGVSNGFGFFPILKAFSITGGIGFLN